MAELVRVGGFPARGHAELAVTYLNEHGIPAVVLADDAGGTYPHIALLSGGVALGVAPADADAARELLAEAQARSVEPDDEWEASGPLHHPWMTWIVRLSAAAVVALLAYSALPPR